VSGVCPRAWGGEIRAGGPSAQSHRPPLSRRDRKKKRFVGQTGQEEKKKKVRTESGRYISSSYKNNLYPACAAARGSGAGGPGQGARSHRSGLSDGESPCVPLTRPDPAMRNGSRSTRSTSGMTRRTSSKAGSSSEGSSGAGAVSTWSR